MKYRTINNFDLEAHPWDPYIPENADKLILGTFPTAEANRKTDFYYPNPNNDFWRILAELCQVELVCFEGDAAVEERKLILKTLNLGIADVGYRVFRQGDGSNDNQLFPIEFTDIFRVVDKYPKLKTLIITSSSDINSVLGWFMLYCELNKIRLAVPTGTLPKTTSLIHNEKTISIKIISSPSRRSPIKGERLIEMYRFAIKGNN